MIKSLLAFLMIGNAAHTADIQVIDGDGFMLDSREIRIWGIDAPELPQHCENRAGETIPCGEIAKRSLGRILAEHTPTCETVTIDRYGRHVSRCDVAGHDLGRILVENGLALDFERFSGGFYEDAMTSARRAQKGLWATNFTPPWEWRDMENKPRL